MAGERVERRLAAILAADVAGYSRLIGADEEGTLGRLRLIRVEAFDPKIAERRGRIVKTTGDGLLVEFASVVDALRCAGEVQGMMAERNAEVPPERRIEFRIGIHQGDIVAEEGDIFGDGVNVAARLEGLAEPGGICISARVQEDAVGRLDLEFEDLGEQSLKNIARPLRVYRVRPALTRLAPTALDTLFRTAGERGSRRGSDGVGEGNAPLALPDKPSIAVLPFQNMSGDPEQEYFADGMVEEIITALSRIRWLFVIARNSSFTYKGQAVDVKQVGRELGVRYVLEGSVRKAGGRVRITGQLIDAATGAHLWADRFDGALDDVFDLQDQVATSVAGVIEPALRAAETRRAVARPTGDLTAYDLYLCAHELALAWDKQSTLRALVLLDRAIERDPRYGPALALAAFCHSQAVWSGWADDSTASRGTGIGLARRALQAGGNDPTVINWAAGALANFGEDIGSLVALIDRSVTLNPGSAMGWFWSGWIRVFAGDPDRALADFETALRLDPRTRTRHFHLTGIGIAHLEARRLDEAAAALFASLQLLPSYVTTYRALASCLAHMGRLDEAREIVRRMRDITAAVPPTSNLCDPEQRAFFASGLRRALEA